MKAATYNRYGAPEVITIEELNKPTPKPGELLIKVHASTVSAADFRARSRIVPRGLAIPTALALGVIRPRRKVLGMDSAGVVEATGSGVTAFSPGEEVVVMLGAKFGGHAEYITVPEGGPIAIKPSGISFEEAAAIPFGGLPALAGFNRAGIKPGEKVLINGASGAVGTAAVQLAKHLGAHVTGVCSRNNRDLVASLGADRVITYEDNDFTAEGAPYDVIMDCVGNASFERVEHLVKPGGSLILVAADLKSALLAPRRTRRTGKDIFLVSANHTAENLSYLITLAEGGHYRPVIERTFPFTDIVAAHQAVESGRKKGNIVLQIAPTPS